MNTKKGFRYYLFIFFFSVVALIAYIAYLSIKEGSIDYDLVYSYALVPPMFTIFLFAFDKVFEMIFPPKYKKEDAAFKNYLTQVGKAITDQCEFSIEEYRRLRENTGFQKSLEQAFRVLTNGETEGVNFQFLDRKFKKTSIEYIALKAVVGEVKKMMENSEKDYQK
jgi:hypothetical protein